MGPVYDRSKVVENFQSTFNFCATPGRHVGLQLPHPDVILFPNATDRADPIGRNIFKKGTGSDSRVGISTNRIVDVTADGAFVLGGSVHA
jgi:hypothetical protein